MDTASVLAVCRVHQLLDGSRQRRASPRSTSAPWTGRCKVHKLGLHGDIQASRIHHGGEDQALYAYSQDDADYWAGGARPGPAAGHLRRKPADRGHQRHRRRDRRTLEDRTGRRGRSHLAPHPLRHLPAADGRAALGQAVHRGRARWAPTSAWSGPAASRPGTTSTGSSSPPTA